MGDNKFPAPVFSRLGWTREATDPMLATSAQPEVLDLRHFSAPALRPLLEQEAARWEKRLAWNYARSIELLLEYINNRSLTGYVAVQRGRVSGYAFGVCEAAKAVVGDVFAFGEGEQQSNPVCEVLLTHLLETLQATPGISRVESQLLLFPSGAFHREFLQSRFHPFPRCFMVCDLARSSRAALPSPSLPPGYTVQLWQPAAFLPAAALIQDAYRGHTDAEINDQYRTYAGAQRFLHNIVQFPGCGVFDAQNSWLLYEAGSGSLAALVLSSRVRSDAAHITQLCVREPYRGRGLGAALLHHCLGHLAANGLSKVSLTVTGSNAGALRLYMREGFETLHTFEAWVWDQHDGK